VSITLIGVAGPEGPEEATFFALVDSGAERVLAVPGIARQIGVTPDRGHPNLARYTAKSPEAFVFLSSQGRHLRRSNFNRRVWQPAIRAAGVEGLRVHDLRHTAGTLATAAGGSLREVMDRLGHSTTVAAVRYQHVMADRDAAIARELNRLIESG
jgi:integrase